MTNSIDDIKPGKALTKEQKEKLGKENADASTEAQRLAAEHRNRDIAEGKGEPAVQAVASLLKGKLERGEFKKKEDFPRPEEKT